jgi:hypothetical protein
MNRHRKDMLSTLYTGGSVEIILIESVKAF